MLMLILTEWRYILESWLLCISLQQAWIHLLTLWAWTHLRQCSSCCCIYFSVSTVHALIILLYIYCIFYVLLVYNIRILNMKLILIWAALVFTCILQYKAPVLYCYSLSCHEQILVMFFDIAKYHWVTAGNKNKKWMTEKRMTLFCYSFFWTIFTASFVVL